MDNIEKPKRLYRSSSNKVFAGVFGGLGEYFNVDPVILRIVYVFLAVFTAIIPAIFVYILAIFIIADVERERCKRNLLLHLRAEESKKRFNIFYPESLAFACVTIDQCLLLKKI